MACLVSTTLSLPLSASHSFEKGIAPRRLSLVVRLSNQPISETAAKPSASSRTNKAMSTSNQSCQDHLRTPSKLLFEIMSCYRNVHSCSHTIIFGFWVGPDIDDGWGYVEAFVNPIT
ncbi:uncharacterized protein LOC126619013 [Malus sylvestris]|uniref:uncharacterized protein LOC126619013 n=1 Tax=Malus sylvestris TaxID=3752 RepID=UPI0021AD30AB|nr:uncharacterized protein LOC126619013 [Malus sylvestris]